MQVSLERGERKWQVPSVPDMSLTYGSLIREDTR